MSVLVFFSHIENFPNGASPLNYFPPSASTEAICLFSLTGLSLHIVQVNNKGRYNAMLIRMLKDLLFLGVRKRRYIEGMMNDALALQQSGSLDDAERAYKALLAKDSAHAGALANLGVVYLQRGDLEKGQQILESSLSIDPFQLDALRNRAKALVLLKKYGEALECYDKAISIDSSLGDLHFNRGSVLKSIGRHEEALVGFGQALAHNPGYVDQLNFLFSRAETFHYLNRNEEALDDFDQAVILCPDRADLYSNRGSILELLGRHSEALANYDLAIACEPTFAPAHFNCGVVLQDMRRYEEAIASYNHAIAFKQDYADAYANRGGVLKELGRYVEALESQRQALAINPYHTEALFNSSLLHLIMGNYVEGWKQYESRWKTTEFRPMCRDFPQPLWLGKEGLAGKTILLHAEQGFGDAIQFCRFAISLKALGANVVLEVQPRLVGLISMLDGCGSFLVIARGDDLPDFDYHCPLMSLPFALGMTLESIPASEGYLTVDSGIYTEWQEKLGASSRKRIGLVWSGSAGNKNDHKRSLPLNELLPLLDLNFEFHVLQKEIVPEDREILLASGVRLHDVDQRDFSDAAALVALMDLVISVDTAVAHLAGALGKQVWILLPYSADFRWLTERTDTPWYQSARLIRQEQAGEWCGVVDKAIQSLSHGLSRLPLPVRVN
jgi:tetratricopeptide (TPR) repeat protein